MIPQDSFRSSTLVYFVIGLALVLASAAVVSVAGYAGLRAELGATSTSSADSHTQATGPDENVEAELVTIRQWRHRTRIHLPQGDRETRLSRRSNA